MPEGGKDRSQARVSTNKNGADLRDDACRILRFHSNGVPFAVPRLVDVEGSQDHGDGDEQRRVCELFPWTDASSEPERDVVRVELGLVS